MKVIHNDPEKLLDNVCYGDTFYRDFNDGNIYIKTEFFQDAEHILCVNVETGSYEFFYIYDNVIPVECSVSVKA